MKKTLLLMLLINLSACNLKDEYIAFNKLEGKEKVWAFIQINVREESDDLESYYYYAQISKDIYTDISQNTLSNGFILLSDTKYWGENDLITDYKNTERNGELVFRIENIARISRMNIAPIAGKGIEQFYEKAQDNSPAKTQEKEDEVPSEVLENNQDAPLSPANNKDAKLPKIDPWAPLDQV